MKRRSHADPVTAEMAQAVFLRDGYCIVPILDPEAWPCSGRSTIEHVKRQLRAGRRAESVMGCLVSLCEGHTEPGMRAGHQWNTDKRNRERVRAYLAEVNQGKAA